MVSKKIIGGIFALVITALTLIGVGFVMTNDVSNPSPVVQSAQIAGAGFSIVLSSLLVILYEQQKNLLGKQTKMVEKQATLQASSMEADVYFSTSDFTKQDRLHFGVTNRGSGKSKNFKLEVEMVPNIGPKSTFEFDLVRYRGDYSNEPLVMPNETNADLYLTTDQRPNVTRGSYNIIRAKLKKKVGVRKIIRFNFSITYDDLVSDRKSVSGFSRFGRIDLNDYDSENPIDSLNEVISEEFEYNLGQLLINDDLIYEINSSVSRMSN